MKRSDPDAPWVGIDMLRDSLPSVHGKQMQRFVDALAEIEFPIGYESKTRGRYWLSVPAVLVRFDLDDAALQMFINERVNVNPQPGPAGVTHAPGSLAAASERRDGWRATDRLVRVGLDLGAGNDPLLASLCRVNLADSQFHDGNLDTGNDHAYEILRRGIETATTDFKPVILLKFALVCRRLHRYGEAQDALRSVSTMVRSGEVAPGNLAYRAQLSLAMLRIDQGRFDDAGAIVSKIDTRTLTDDGTLGAYHHLSGLLLGHEMDTRHQIAVNTGVPLGDDVLQALMRRTTHAFGQALTLAAITNDYQTMQQNCLALGSLFFCAHRLKLFPTQGSPLLKRGVSWITQGEFIGKKFGVGMDSVRGQILLMQSALDGGLGLVDLNVLTDGMFKNFVDLHALAMSTLAEAVRVGNRIEQAEILIILASLSLGKGKVNEFTEHQQHALEIYRRLKRPDLTRQLKKKFVKDGSFVGELG